MQFSKEKPKKPAQALYDVFLKNMFSTFRAMGNATNLAVRDETNASVLSSLI
jgi:hypothetical protein